MDIVGNLPQEISQHVLSFLTPPELIKCFHVCKKWYNLANTDFLWKRHCVLELLLSADTNIPVSSSNGQLCKWGTIYRSFKRKVNRFFILCL
nr:F-box only protein 16 isoform X3 [Halyomorpha halys]